MNAIDEVLIKTDKSYRKRIKRGYRYQVRYGCPGHYQWRVLFLSSLANGKMNFQKETKGGELRFYDSIPQQDAPNRIGIMVGKGI